ATKLREFAADPAAFRVNLLIDADGRLAPFRPDAWQDADFRALDAGWRRVVGQSVHGGYSRGYLERPRGHSKTHDIAVMAVWALAFSPRRLAGYAAAADRDQARLIALAVEKIICANVWLEVLECQQWKVVNRRTGSTLEILSSDAPTSYGLTPDFIAID